MWKTYRVAICVVAAMGLLFLVGLFVLIGAILFGTPYHKESPKTPLELLVSVAPQARLHSLTVARGTLILHIRGAYEEILLIDPRNGKLLRRIRLQPAP